MNKKPFIIVASVIAGLVLVLGLLYYYQSQGYIKIFPTEEDRQIKRILQIDRSKFAAPEGLSEQAFAEKIKALEAHRQAVLDNPTDAQAWFVFGHAKDFLNDHQGAVWAWEKTLQLQPLNFVAAVNLGNTYQYFIRDFVKAEVYYKHALEVSPALTSAYQGLIDLYSFNLTGKQMELAPTVEKAAEKDSGNAGRYYATYAEFLVRSSQIEKARIYAAKARPLDAEAYRDLVETYPILKQ